MAGHVKRDGLGKRAVRSAYGLLLGGHALASAVTSGRGTAPLIFYGGARSGDSGGPLVKVKRLKERFPEHRWRYNAIYALSNAPYLPDVALCLAKSRKIPLVHNQNGVFYAAWFDGDWKAQNARMARTYHQADHVFFQSAFCRRAAERFLGERSGPGEILFNAIDTERFRPSSEGDPPGGGRRLTFLATGRIGGHLFYRLESTLRGLALARKQGLDARLTIAGDLDASAAALSRQLTDDLGISEQVSFHGPYAQADAPALYAAADGYVTTKHQDPCPNAVLEALACGLPVLYSASGGVPELVGPDAGIGLEAPEDWEKPHVPSAEAIADGMMRIAVDRERMAAAARARAVAMFDIRPWLDRHAVVFGDLLAARR